MDFKIETKTTNEEHLIMLIKEIRTISKKIQDLEKQAEHIVRKGLY